MRSLLFLLASFAATVPASAQDMVAVSWSGSSYEIDSASGVGSLLGASGFASLNSLAKHPSTAKLYANAGSQIIEINPATGAGTLVVTTTLSSLGIRGMAFLGNTLYAVVDGTPDSLYTINLATGATTWIGSTGYAGMQGLTESGGVLYGWEVGTGSGYGVGLVTVDPVTGWATDVDINNGGNAFEIQTLCSDGSGNLYGARDGLYTVNKITGVTTLVGSGGYSDVRGIEFTGSGAPSFTLAKAGNCPGSVTLTTTNGTPSSAVAILYGNAGSWTKPSGTCAGLTLGIASPNLGAIIGSNGSGTASISFNSQAAWCGKTVQAVDIATCTASNTITL
jgi:hypothetical protein